MTSSNPLIDLLSTTRSALLVVDMQNDFCAADGFIASLGLDTAPCRAIVDKLAQLIDNARTSGVPVLWAWANYDEALVPPSFNRRKQAAGITRTCCVPGTTGYAPFGVSPNGGEPVFVKHNYSALTNPDFQSHLEAEGIETLVFAGVQTNVCVEATLRDAYNRGYNVVVAEDCVASHTTSLHEATLNNVRALLGEVASADSIAGAWRDTADTTEDEPPAEPGGADRPPKISDEADPLAHLAAPPAKNCFETYRSLVLPAQCDHIGHMNVRWYAHHLDEAGFQIWTVANVRQAEMRDRGIQVVVARTTTDFVKEMTAGTSIVVRAGFTRVGTKSVMHLAKMFNADTGDLSATQETVEVFFDPKTRKPAPMPADFKARLSALVVDPANI